MVKQCSNVQIEIGYIGGTVLDYVYKAHPDYEYTLFVRNEERAKPIKAKYPNVKFVYGSLEDSDVLRNAVLKTDVVIRTLALNRILSEANKW